MGKSRQQQKSSLKISKKKAIMIGIAAVIASSAAIFGYYSFIPANGSSPVLGVPSTHFIKASHSTSSGYVFVNKMSASAKGQMSNADGGIVNPTYTFPKGSLQSIHVINSDYYTHSKHNFNIDEFNVHSKDLSYFETQGMTFVADKAGTFEYYCTIHPEMKGVITIQ